MPEGGWRFWYVIFLLQTSYIYGAPDVYKRYLRHEERYCSLLAHPLALPFHYAIILNCFLLGDHFCLVSPIFLPQNPSAIHFGFSSSSTISMSHLSIADAQELIEYVSTQCIFGFTCPSFVQESYTCAVLHIVHIHRESLSVHSDWSMLNTLTVDHLCKAPKWCCDGNSERVQDCTRTFGIGQWQLV